MKNNRHLFDKPENVQKFLWVFFTSLVVLLVVDFFVPKHPHFPWEGDPEFFAAYGFISCVALIFIAKLLRLMVRRDEHYYDK